MKKNISMIIIAILLIFTIIFTSYKSTNIKIHKKIEKDPVYYNNIELDITINKTDELGNPLSGVIFKLKDLNNKFEGKIPESNIPGIYEYYENTYSRYSFQDIVDLLPETKQNIINEFKTREDIEKSNLDAQCSSDHCVIYEDAPLIIEEVKVPSGYIKEKKMILGYMDLYYYFDNDQINKKGVIAYASTEYYFDDEELINFSTFTEDLYAGKYDNIIKSDCGRTINERVINYKSNDSPVQFSQIETCGMNIVNKKGTIDLEIKNLVNEKSNVTTTTNKTLKYQIQIENKGTASSTENTIVTEVPKGLEYVEDSASHDGEYNKEEHEVMWRIDEIESEETVELTYEAIVPKDADPNIKYVGITSINSREVPENIKSKETIVSLEKLKITNPKTNNLVNFLILIIAGIVGTGIYITTYKTKTTL